MQTPSEYSRTLGIFLVFCWKSSLRCTVWPANSMHAQLVRKPGTVNICYHGLSAHEEQFAITTDGTNGHCPIAWTEGQPGDAQPSQRCLSVLTSLDVTSDVFQSLCLETPWSWCYSNCDSETARLYLGLIQISLVCTWGITALGWQVSRQDRAAVKWESSSVRGQCRTKQPKNHQVCTTTLVFFLRIPFPWRL